MGQRQTNPYMVSLRWGITKNMGVNTKMDWKGLTWIIWGTHHFRKFSFFSQQMTMCTTGFHTFTFPGVWLFGGCLYIRWLHYPMWYLCDIILPAFVDQQFHSPMLCIQDAISYCAPSVTWCQLNMIHYPRGIGANKNGMSLFVSLMFVANFPMYLIGYISCLLFPFVWQKCLSYFPWYLLLCFH